jgi:lycopene cyclase domain-containing protein
MSTYLWVNLGAIAVPLLCSFHPRLRFDRTWRAFWPANLISAAIFILWDILYTHWGVWGFNPLHLSGHALGGLPAEEWLFFVCIPYACVFTYHCLKTLVRRDLLAGAVPWITWSLAAGLGLTALFNLGRIYTSVTFLLSAAFLLLHLAVWRSPYLGRFYLGYLAIIPPFLLVNGILTGSFIHQQVVWYDDSENLGIRCFTIPVEDFFYGLLLILLNVTLFERFSRDTTSPD